MRKIALYLLLTCIVTVGLMSCSQERPDQAAAPESGVASRPALKSGGGDGNIVYTEPVVLGGTTHIGVILAEFDDTASLDSSKSFQLNSTYEQTIMDALTGTDGSVDQLYEEMSGHLATPVRFTAQLIEKVVIDSSLRGLPSECPTSTDDWNDAATDTAVAHGADLSGFDCIMVVMSTDNTCAAPNWLRSQAFAFTSPPSVIINKWDWSNNDYSHELGHLLGFGHSNTPVFDYWDYSCLMGENAEYNEVGFPINPIPPRHLNVIWKLAAGYIDPVTEMLQISGGGTQTAYLAPSEYRPSEVVDPAGDTAYKAVRVDGDQDTYYVSYRQPRPPFDSDPAGPSPLDQMMNRIHVHRFISSPAEDHYPSVLLAVLQADPGQDTFEIDDVRITVLSDGLDGDVDYVQIEVEVADCTSGISATMDETVTTLAVASRFPKSAFFPIEVTNANGPTCGPGSFSYKIEPLASVSWFTQPMDFLTVEIPSGGTTTVSPQIIFFSDPGDGVYEAEVQYYWPGAPTETVPVSCVLDRVAPTVPGGLTATLNGCSVDLSWNSSYDATSGVSHYEVYRDGVYLDQTTATSMNDVLVDPASGATHSYTVAAVDGAGHVSPTSAPAQAALPTVVISQLKVLRTNAVNCTITVTWKTDVPSTSVVRFGNACGNEPNYAYSAGMTTNHRVVCDVFDLQYFAFHVESSDGCVTAKSACQVKQRGTCLSQ